MGFIYSCISSIKKSQNCFNYDIRDLDSNEIYSRIENDKLDLGIVENNKFIKPFVSRSILVDDYYLIISKNHKWASGNINFTHLKRTKFCFIWEIK